MKNELQSESPNLRAFGRAFVALLVCGVACGGDSTRPETGPGTTLPTGSFTISSATAVSVAQGAAVTVPIAIARTGGFGGPVLLSVAGLPAGVTAAFDAATVLVGQTTSMLALTAAVTSPVGTTIVTVIGTSSGLTNQSATFSLGILARAAFEP